MKEKITYEEGRIEIIITGKQFKHDPLERLRIMQGKEKKKLRDLTETESKGLLDFLVENQDRYYRGKDNQPYLRELVDKQVERYEEGKDFEWEEIDTYLKDLVKRSDDPDLAEKYKEHMENLLEKTLNKIEKYGKISGLREEHIEEYYNRYQVKYENILVGKQKQELTRDDGTRGGTYRLGIPIVIREDVNLIHENDYKRYGVDQFLKEVKWLRKKDIEVYEKWMYRLEEGTRDSYEMTGRIIIVQTKDRQIQYYMTPINPQNEKITELPLPILAKLQGKIVNTLGKLYEDNYHSMWYGLYFSDYRMREKYRYLIVNTKL